MSMKSGIKKQFSSKKKRFLIIILLFLTGLLYRLLLIKIFPQPFAFDQLQYRDYANLMKVYGLYAHSFRIYGYPLFILVIDKISNNGLFLGFNNFQLAQAVLDTISALLVFGTAGALFRSYTKALISYILYLFNPFTSGFTGVMLPEVLAAFLFSSLYFLSITFLKSRSLILVFFTGIILGFIPQVRPVYYFFSIFMFFLMLFYVLKRFVKDFRWILLFFLSIGFCIPFIYTVWGNYQWYSEISLMDVDRLSIENFYISMFVKRSKKIPVSMDDYPKEVRWAYNEYSYRKDTPEKRKTTRDLFFRLALEEIKNNPVKFIIWRIEKMWYIWEKHMIFPYNNGQTPILSIISYWGNVIYLFLAAMGFIFWSKAQTINNFIKGKGLVLFTGFPIFYTTVANAFSSTEERYSLPVYPLIILFGGFGLFVIFNFFLAKNR